MPGGTAEERSEGMDAMQSPERVRSEEVGKVVMLARSALRKGDNDEGRRRLMQALALDPSDCAAIELLGDLYMAEGEQEKAVRVFTKGLSFHPHYRPFEEKMALCYLDLDEMKH